MITLIIAFAFKGTKTQWVKAVLACACIDGMALIASL